MLPLTEDASVNSKSTMLHAVKKIRLVLEVFNIFNASVSDIDYFYTSRLPGESLSGVDDIHAHPAPPRSARLGFQMTF